MDELIHILKNVEGSTIIYVRNRQHTADISKELQKAGFSAHFFHAGLNYEEKIFRQDAWKRGDCRIIVATNAFGMGIDKPDVRLVIHMDMPGSLEEYFQEAGRAGRDGKKSYAIALCSSTEKAKLKKRLTDEYPDRRIITRIYEALGNYFQIAVGFGEFVSHGFPIQDFCKKFNFSETQTNNAIKILQLAGYLEYVEEPDSSSRLLFIVDRDELYHMTFSPFAEELIQVILRSYTGPFADYVFIDESLIATRTHSTHDEVYKELVSLSKSHILSYIPRKKMPQIVFTRRREEARRVVIARDAYEVRQRRSEERINKVIEYITEERICRSRLLLRYFGEKSETDCRKCDVCVRKLQSGVRLWEFNIIRDKLTAVLSEKKSESVTTLAYNLPLEKDKNLTILRYLLDNDVRFKQKDGMIYYNE